MYIARFLTSVRCSHPQVVDAFLYSNAETARELESSADEYINVRSMYKTLLCQAVEHTVCKPLLVSRCLR